MMSNSKIINPFQTSFDFKFQDVVPKWFEARKASSYYSNSILKLSTCSTWCYNFEIKTQVSLYKDWSFGGHHILVLSDGIHEYHTTLDYHRSITAKTAGLIPSPVVNTVAKTSSMVIPSIVSISSDIIATSISCLMSSTIKSFNSKPNKRHNINFNRGFNKLNRRFLGKFSRKTDVRSTRSQARRAKM